MLWLITPHIKAVAHSEKSCLNACRCSTGGFKYRFKMFGHPYFVLALLEMQLSETAFQGGKCFKGSIFHMETSHLLLHFESSLMPLFGTDLLILNYSQQMTVSHTMASQGALHLCKTNLWKLLILIQYFLSLPIFWTTWGLNCVTFFITVRK